MAARISRARHRSGANLKMEHIPGGTLDVIQARLEALGYDVKSGWEFGSGNRAIYPH